MKSEKYGKWNTGSIFVVKSIIDLLDVHINVDNGCHWGKLVIIISI